MQQKNSHSDRLTELNRFDNKLHHMSPVFVLASDMDLQPKNTLLHNLFLLPLRQSDHNLKQALKLTHQLLHQKAQAQ